MAELRVAGQEILDLTETNPTRVGLSELAREERELLAAAEIERYEPDPRGLATARAAVAGLYLPRPVVDEVVLTSGTSESYAHLFRLLTDPGDAVLVPTPSYPLFEPIARLEGVEVIPYRLAYDGAWHMDLASLDAALDRHSRPRAVVVVQPNHPTGSALDVAEIDALQERCASRSLALISDEVFLDFPWRRAERSPLSLIAHRQVPTFVLGGLSKSCGLPQLKLGWIVTSGPEPQRTDLLAGLEWIGDTFLSVSAPVQAALPVLLTRRESFRSRVLERIACNLDTLDQLLKERPEVSLLDAQAGWAAILRVPARHTGEEWALGLLDRGVAVHPGHFYDLEGEAYLVLSLIPQPDVFRTAIGRLAAALTIL